MLPNSSLAFEVVLVDCIFAVILLLLSKGDDEAAWKPWWCCCWWWWWWLWRLSEPMQLLLCGMACARLAPPVDVSIWVIPQLGLIDLMGFWCLVERGFKFDYLIIRPHYLLQLRKWANLQNDKNKIEYVKIRILVQPKHRSVGRVLLLVTSPSLWYWNRSLIHSFNNNNNMFTLSSFSFLWLCMCANINTQHKRAEVGREGMERTNTALFEKKKKKNEMKN